MALTGWIYQPIEIAQDFFSSGGNVAEKIVQVKGGKFQMLFWPESNHALYKSVRLRDCFGRANSG